jgi:hypothetical protein
MGLNSLNEEWRSVSGFDGVYEVSNLGRVRSVYREVAHVRTDQYSGRPLSYIKRLQGVLLKPGRMPGGHLSVAIGRDNSICVHNLVLTAFVGQRPDGMECLHINGVPSDNRLCNLRWGTRSENLLDAVKHGVKPVGERCHNAKLKNTQIPTIRSMFGKKPYREIAAIYGVSDRTIRQIAKNITWKHIEATQ